MHPAASYHRFYAKSGISQGDRVVVRSESHVVSSRLDPRTDCILSNVERWQALQEISRYARLSTYHTLQLSHCKPDRHVICQATARDVYLMIIIQSIYEFRLGSLSAINAAALQC